VEKEGGNVPSRLKAPKAARQNREDLIRKKTSTKESAWEDYKRANTFLSLLAFKLRAKGKKPCANGRIARPGEEPAIGENKHKGWRSREGENTHKTRGLLQKSHQAENLELTSRESAREGRMKT